MTNQPAPHAALDASEKKISAGVVWLMALSVGVVVANMYYVQPLLAIMAREFHLTIPEAGGISTVTQIGVAVGMLFLVPLGDICERRALIVLLILVSALSLIATALAQNSLWLLVASFVVGSTAACVHVIMPFAAHLAPEAQRGKIVGKVMSGLLMGILLARTVSGLLGAWYGWRMVYGLAAAAMLVLAVLVHLFLPAEPPVVQMRYRDLFRSMGNLIQTQPALRESALLGALLFCTFSAFWTTLVFLLKTPPYHYGSETAGLFGLVGALGAAGAPWVGHLGDKHGPRLVVGGAIVLVFVSFLFMGVFGFNLLGLIVGVIVMDLGIQAGHVANQGRIYSLIPAARSRLNTVYMTCYFIGGSAGSYLGAYSWHLFGWWGVCGFSLGVMALAIVCYLRLSPK